MPLLPLPPLSLRGKMLLPAMAAVVATAIATGVTLFLSGRAAAQLAAAREREFPAMLFCQNMRAMLAQADALLKYAGESDNFVTRVDQPETVYLDMSDAFEKDGARVLGTAEARALRAELDAYWEAARTDAAVKVSNRIKFRAERASRPGGAVVSGSTPEEMAALARTQEIDNQYQALYVKFDTRAARARAAMDAGLSRSATRQKQSIIVGALILLASAGLSAVLAWWSSGRAAHPVRVLSRAALRIAQGDLTQEVKVDSDDEIGVLAASFQRMVTRLRDLVATLKSAAEEMAHAAAQLAESTRAQTAVLERQASGVAETSSTTRQLEQTSAVAASRAASVLEVARRAAEMSDAGREGAERSAGELHRIQRSVEGIVARSTQLLENTRQVGDIVETVRDLAAQSHVLSLNASIEAARAGEAGRSFAVVAQEVRALSEQSGQGAARIARMVEEILAAVQSTRETTERGSQGMAGSLDQIRASGESLREIGGIVRETSDAALHIASAVQQQSTGIAQIASAMRDLDRGMAETMERIRSLELSARQVGEMATRISGVAAEFTL